VTDRPCGKYLATDHAHDPGEPARRPQQVRYQPQAEEAGFRLLRGRVLLEDEPRPDEQGREQGEPVVETDVEIHDALTSRPAEPDTAET
jgi:hypothetical protein